MTAAADLGVPRAEAHQPVSATPASSHARTGRAILSFLGATGTVTGSTFLIDHDVVLTHAHLDHCAYLPALVREGFTGPVWCTHGTAALAAIVLRDSAHLFERDAEDARAGGWSKHDSPLPLYTSADVERAVSLLHPVAYDSPPRTGPGLELLLCRAGHILGSASVLLRAGDARVLFSGDLGRPHHDLPLPRADPPATDVVVVVVESTYGNRIHHPADPSHPVLAQAIGETVGRGGSVLIPAFAIDRTELVIHTLRHLMTAGDIPAVPVYLDSPMALAALAVYRGQDLGGELRSHVPQSVLDWSSLRLARSAEESKALNNPGRPCIVVSASGKASGGRVVHHLRSMLPHRRNTIVLTGYQAVGNRGRDLQDGARALKMMGGYVPVRAQIVTDDGFSVHADAGEIVDWLGKLPAPTDDRLRGPRRATGDTRPGRPRHRRAGLVCRRATPRGTGRAAMTNGRNPAHHRSPKDLPVDRTMREIAGGGHEIGDCVRVDVGQHRACGAGSRCWPG